MTKKRIRYSELATPPDAPPPASAPPSPEAVASPVAPPVAPPVAQAGSPLAIARRLTPARANLVIPRPTPARAALAVPTPASAPPIAARASVVLPPPVPAIGRPSVTLVADDPSPAAAQTFTLRERARARRGHVDLLVFRVGPEWFGVDLAAVEEAIDLPAVRHVPEMPPAMVGVVTVRTMLTPVFAPGSVLGVTGELGTSALVFRRARGRVAIAVDDVDDVHTLDLALLRDAPGVDARDGILLGVIRYRATLLALVDAEALIAACQIVPLLETA